MKIHVYFVGKPRDPHANHMAVEYLKRASRWVACEMRELSPRRADPWQKHPAARKVALDPAGRKLDSAQFLAMVREMEREGRDLVFAVGGHDGLPEGWRAGADTLLTLSPMTFPHELARAMLAEQIYRALATLRGHPYPR
jgi:23S rRNA (pseudouridine1915-N3)-methyltransferase